MSNSQGCLFSGRDAQAVSCPKGGGMDLVNSLVTCAVCRAEPLLTHVYIYFTHSPYSLVLYIVSQSVCRAHLYGRHHLYFAKNFDVVIF